MNISVISRWIFSLAMVVTSVFSARGSHASTSFQGPNTSPNTTITTQAGSGKLYLPLISTPSAYYVSPSGSDSNPGSISRPWRTISKAASVASAGDTVYVRGGTYAEQVTLYKSGTASSPINFQAYPNETPAITGNSLGMTSWSALVSISGSYITFSGFEVSYSSYIGLIIKGTHDVVDRAYSHHNQQNGIIICGDYNTVQNSRVWRNALANEYNASSGGYSTGLSAARDADGVTDYAVIRNNIVWENWGEGISTYEANQIIVDGNISHDNLTANIYISDTTNAMVQNNLVYMDPSSYVYGKNSNVGIMMGDEKYTPPSANITVINNIAYGNHRNYMWWQGSQGGGMNNVLIGGNTFVNGSGDGSNGNSNVIICPGPHQNVRFEDNIIQQDSSIELLGAASIPDGVTYSHNLWSRTPRSYASGPGDVIGNPLLAKTGSPFAAAWFALTSGSPAIQHGLILSQLLLDFARATRGSPPDIGALQYHP